MPTITDMTEYRTITDAKAHLNELIDLVETSGEQVIITRKGLPAARLIGVDDYEGILETIEVLSTPGILEQIREAEREFARGEFVTGDQVREEFLRPDG